MVGFVDHRTLRALKIGRRNQAAAKSRESRHTGLPADPFMPKPQSF
jgi:hypothetical protein